MTNLESFDAESATEKTTKPESANVNMSAGAEMLIARMRTNPDDFKYQGRFYRVVDAINAKGQGWISERDYRALSLAYQEHIQEADFSEWVYNEIFNPKEPEPVQNLYAQMQSQGQQAQVQRAMQNAMLSGSWGPSVAVGAGGIATTTHSTGLFGSIKNKLGV